MLKNLLKIMLFCFVSFQSLSAVSVNDGYEEYNNGNVFQALNIFEKACEGGAYSGCYNAGLIYFKGDRVEQDYEKAANLFIKACDEGHSEACYNVAYMFENGLGVRQDPLKALSLYDRSCQNGVSAACYNLGIMYEKEDGVEKDSFKAVDYLTQARNLDHAKA